MATVRVPQVLTHNPLTDSGRRVAASTPGGALDARPVRPGKGSVAADVAFIPGTLTANPGTTFSGLRREVLVLTADAGVQFENIGIGAHGKGGAGTPVVRSAQVPIVSVD